jgi:deazaflavin-dependent oxidoreductase (nitroreductase family)
VAEGHGRFAFLNHTGNPVLKALLRSPLHGVADGRLALITVTGRRSGREYTFPVAYRHEGDLVTIEVGWPERKVWWRNLVGGGPVRMRIRGKEREGFAEAIRDECMGVRVEVRLSPAD